MCSPGGGEPVGQLQNPGICRKYGVQVILQKNRKKVLPLVGVKIFLKILPIVIVIKRRMKNRAKIISHENVSGPRLT